MFLKEERKRGKYNKIKVMRVDEALLHAKLVGDDTTRLE